MWTIVGHHTTIISHFASQLLPQRLAVLVPASATHRHVRVPRNEIRAELIDGSRFHDTNFLPRLRFDGRDREFIARQTRERSLEIAGKAANKSTQSETCRMVSNTKCCRRWSCRRCWAASRCFVGRQSVRNPKAAWYTDIPSRTMTERESMHSEVSIIAGPSRWLDSQLPLNGGGVSIFFGCARGSGRGRAAS